MSGRVVQGVQNGSWGDQAVIGICIWLYSQFSVAFYSGSSSWRKDRCEWTGMFRDRACSEMEFKDWSQICCGCSTLAHLSFSCGCITGSRLSQRGCWIQHSCVPHFAPRTPAYRRAPYHTDSYHTENKSVVAPVKSSQRCLRCTAWQQLHYTKEFLPGHILIPVHEGVGLSYMIGLFF